MHNAASGSGGRNIHLFTILSFALGFALTRVYASVLAVLATFVDADISLDSDELGSIASVFPFALALAQPVNGVLLDRYGPARVVSPLLLLAVAGAVMFAFATSQATLMIGYGLIGLGVSATLMGGLLVLSSQASPRQMATLMAVLMAAGGLGQVLTASPLACLASVVGWRIAMLCIAGVTLIVAGAVMRATPARASSLNSESLVASFAGYRDIVRQPGFLPIFALSCVGFAVVFAVRGLWAGPYLRDVFGLDPVSVGHAVLAMTVGIIAGTLAFGPLDRLAGSRKRVVLGGALGSIAALLLLVIAGRQSVQAAVLLLCLLGFIGSYDAVLLAHGRALFAPRMAGRGLTALNIGTFLGAGAVQVTAGWLVSDMLSGPDASASTVYSIVFTYFAVLIGAGALAYAFAPDRPPASATLASDHHQES
jgi:predicted MFS family arabinose efflux permease